MRKKWTNFNRIRERDILCHRFVLINDRTVLFDEIDAKLMHNRRALLGLPEDDFFTRSVAITVVLPLLNMTWTTYMACCYVVW